MTDTGWIALTAPERALLLKALARFQRASDDDRDAIEALWWWEPTSSNS
jgi:hypothetical protein